MWQGLGAAAVRWVLRGASDCSRRVYSNTNRLVAGVCCVCWAWAIAMLALGYFSFAWGFTGS